MGDLWKHTITEGVAVAAFDHPPMNYLTAAGLRELSALIDRWRARDVRTVVLTSARDDGRFITHYSVEDLLEQQRDPAAIASAGARRHDSYHLLLQRLNDLGKPVIAAMNGDTMGGGLELCLACDIRIGQVGDHRYGLPEVRLGILPGGSGTQRMARLIGAGNAVEFCMRGRVVTPDRALQLGLVHEVVADARTHATELAQGLAELSPTALAMIKRAVYEGADLPLAAGLRIEADACLAARLAPDAADAMEAYVSIPLEERRAWLEQGP